MTARSILITGCSSGIGRDAALTLHTRGWQVFATTRSEADRTALEARGIVSPHLDYTDPESLQSALDTVLEATNGRLDALFNNGAHAVPGALEDLPTNALRQIFEANFFGWHDLTRRVIPVMRRQGYGRIVNHSSVLGYSTLPWRGAYNATKHALEGLTDTLRIEMRDTPIHVITLNTGPVTSRIRENAIPHFERHVNWKSSARRADYEARLLPRLYEDRGPDPFERPASAVTAVLIRALESRRPRPRYRITVPSTLMEIARRMLSTRGRDRLLSQAR